MKAFDSVDSMVDDLDALSLAGEAYIEYGPVPAPNKRDWKAVIQLLETPEVAWDDLSSEDKDSLAHADRQDRGRPTILHRIAQSWEGDGFSKLSRSSLQKIVLFLLDKKIRHINDSEDPVLTVALNYHNLEFIDFVITQRAELLSGLLMQTGDKGMNCLHKAFEGTLMDDLRELLKNKNDKPLVATLTAVKRLVVHAIPESLVARDIKGNTPIHHALEYKLCLIPRRLNYTEIIEGLVERAEPALKKVKVLFNDIQESPYLCHLRTEGVSRKARIAAQQKAAQQAAQQAAKDINTKGRGNGKETPVHTKDDAGKPPIDNLGRHLGSSRADESSQTKMNRPSAPRDVQYAARNHAERESQNHAVPLGALTGTEGQTALVPKPLSRRPTASIDPESNPQPKHISLNIKSGISAAKKGTPEKVPWSWEEANLVSAEIREFLKCYFIRTRPDREAKDLLYGKIASDKNLFFDASHLRGKDVADVVRLIDNISKAGGFEDTLSYVRIPRVVSSSSTTTKPLQAPYSANEKRQLKTRALDARGKGRDTLVEVFDKLIAVNVRKILRLEVEDNGEEWAHTDTAIERAIKGFDKYSGGSPRHTLEVEVWNWYKPDINLDIIVWAAPMVQHIHLHWSGNQAVLYGWASENGIPFLYRSSGMLEKVTLHAYQGTESRERRKDMTDRFKELIKTRTHEAVVVEIHPHQGSVVVSALPGSEANSLLGEQLERPRSHAWIETMEKFRTALFDIHRQGIVGEPKRVKIALIDDGVDLNEFNPHQFAQYTGVSYYSGNGREDEPWWKSTNGHGTIMANMISRINPWIVLDVIKIQSSPSYIHGEGARSISPRSAADAIEAAVVHGADIISMSWTITALEYLRTKASTVSSDGEGENKSAVEYEMELLRKAITKAVEGDKRLLICSAADDLRVSADNTLPYSQAPAQILRIGPTGPLADREQGSNNSNSITYYLPGNQVAEEQRAHSAKPVVYHNGSSVSTALAAGLASLIIYCARCVHSAGSNEKYADWADLLRDQSNMRKAFKNIGRYQEWEDPKIVPVWALFGDKCRQLTNAKTKEKKVEVLEELVTYLCQDILVSDGRRSS